jgi:polyketide biosynthesis enoyl-CoA hydratase PksI
MNLVINFQEIDEEIVLLTMEDKIHKNGFSDELNHDLRQSFERIDNSRKYKAVILTGYDTYFSTGGTQKELLAGQEGKFQFHDLKTHDLLLSCKIPVIAAMQGHAIGAGFALGLSADFIIFSKESFYSFNFMNYGFTPGFCSTMLATEKLGIGLAEEMLFTADRYKGAELEKRGIPFPVLLRKDVLTHSFKLARRLADKPRVSLVVLKDHLAEPLRKKLPVTVEKENTMHEKTFHLPETRERILKLFGS